MKMAVERAARRKPKLKLGICGEHGGDPRRSSSATRSASTTCPARRTACRSPGWRRRRRPSRQPRRLGRSGRSRGMNARRRPGCAHDRWWLAAARRSALAAGSTREGVPPPSNTFFYPSSAVHGPRTASGCSSPTRTPTSVTTTARWSRCDSAAAANDWVGNDSLGPGSPARRPITSSPGYPEPPHFCCWDQLDSQHPQLRRAPYIQSAATVRIGSFAAGMVMQNASPPHDQAGMPCATTQVEAHRLFVAVRGDTSVTWVDLAPGARLLTSIPYAMPPSLDCGSASGSTSAVPTCDASNRSTRRR